ncbi:hypothetical protein [Actinomadura sp. NBRC 104425]|uniref:hypothetical protein n=1 Tax=Actinomadura sp. NBRC 104425 TaxID=3032204 RepID=UPI002557AC0F|nr:hypothetical protein [Actinomadura sp. NBRC 104425]
MRGREDARAPGPAATGEATAAEKQTTTPADTPEPKQMAGSPGEPRGQRPEEFSPDDFE